MDRQTDKSTWRQTDRQTKNRRTGRQTIKQKEKQAKWMNINPKDRHRQTNKHEQHSQRKLASQKAPLKSVNIRENSCFIEDFRVEIFPWKRLIGVVEAVNLKKFFIFGAQSVRNLLHFFSGIIWHAQATGNGNRKACAIWKWTAQKKGSSRLFFFHFNPSWYQAIYLSISTVA